MRKCFENCKVGGEITYVLALIQVMSTLLVLGCIREIVGGENIEIS